MSVSSGPYLCHPKVQRYTVGGATGVFNGGDWLGGRFQKLKGLALRTRGLLVSPIMQLGVRGLQAYCQEMSQIDE